MDSVTIHPEYDADTVDNDVAMLRLPVTLTASPSRGVACLPAPSQPLPANQLCTIIGWGKSRVTDDYGTDVLHEARVRYIQVPSNLIAFTLLKKRKIEFLSTVEFLFHSFSI